MKNLSPFAKLQSLHPRRRGLLGLGVAGVLTSLAIGQSAWSTPSIEPAAGPSLAAPALPEAPPLLVRDLAVPDALAANKAIPLAGGPNPAAAPFRLGGAGTAAQARAVECLASAIYYEAGTEEPDGQKGVAQVVLNRVRHPAFPASVCEVVFQGSTRSTGCQFTFTCDGSLARQPTRRGWENAVRIARAALSGTVHAAVGNATHYHADYVLPYWASSLAKNAIIGTHIFYRWSGGWGRPSAFTQAYSGTEPSPSGLRLAALGAVKARLASADSAAEIASEADLAELARDSAGNVRRIGARFNPKAREAVEAIERVAYVDRVAASDNLRWTLGKAEPETAQEPLGKAKAGGAATGATSLR